MLPCTTTSLFVKVQKLAWVIESDASPESGWVGIALLLCGGLGLIGLGYYHLKNPDCFLSEIKAEFGCNTGRF
jgi:hypothetical protein